jgi:SAM-dependent methyltransferase
VAAEHERTSDGGNPEAYSLGYEAATLRLFQQRTLTGCASFLLPYLQPGMMILDCGCGPGSLSLELAERVAPGPVVGIDREPSQLATAREAASARGLSNIRFDEADVYSLPFPDGSFDVVFSHALISHLGEPIRALAEQRRVLRPEGLVAVSENDTGTMVCSPSGSAMERVLGLVPRVLEHHGGNRLLTRHLRGALLEAGFARAEGYAGVEVYGRPAETRLLAVAWAAMVGQPAFIEAVISQGWATPTEVAELPAAVREWGERPDAYGAVLKCGALGWITAQGSDAQGGNS